tara:strand:+ start:1223 stop:2134 length:912 start_codon:yes stop_codon:yes gene_type:complete
MRIKYLINRLVFNLKNENFITVIKKIIKTIFTSNKIDLDKLKLDENISLDDLFIKFGSDKGSLDGKKTYSFLKLKDKNRFSNYLEWINRDNLKKFDYQLGHNFTPIYEKYFSEIRLKNLKILEIGTANGHSVASFFYYFPNSKIFTIDIKKSFHFFYKSERISFETIDCMNDQSVKNFISRFGGFDIIIDDSDHTHPTFVNNIKNFYPSLNSGGLYFLEDFKYADQDLLMIRNYNEKFGKKVMMQFIITMDEIFTNIKNKKFFEHDILNKESQEYIFDKTESVNVHYGEHPLSSLGILKKKNN